MSKILIHAIYAEGDVFVCHHPECKFVGTLPEGIEHTVKNQFVVPDPPKRKPVNLYKI